MSQSLYGLLATLDKDELTGDDAALLRDLIISKVDNCALFETELAAEADRLRAIAQEFAEAAKSAKKRLERYQRYILHAMNSNEFEMVPGERFQLFIKEKPAKVIVETDPTEFDHEAYPDLVRVKYEWDKDAIKETLKVKDVPFARTVREKKAVFSVKRSK